MEVFELKVLKLKVSKLKVSNLKGLSKFSPRVSLVMNICGTLFFLIFELFDPIPLFLFVRWFGFSFVFDFPNSACLQTFSAIPTFITTGPTNTDISWGTFKQTDAIYWLDTPLIVAFLVMMMMVLEEVSASIILEPSTSEGWTINNTSAVGSLHVSSPQSSYFSWGW